MKPGNIALTLGLLLAAGMIVYLYVTRPGTESSRPEMHGMQTLTFAGRTVELPDGWTRDGFASSDTVLVLKHDGSRLTLTDQRMHPELSRDFLSAWQRALNAAGSHRPQSVDGYTDADTTSSQLTCVAERWTNEREPLQLTCLGATGGWRLTLAGEESETADFDMLARQMPTLESR